MVSDPTVATTDLVEYLTGVTIDQPTLMQATGIIEISASVSCRNLNSFRARDRNWLVRAICYQAAWMPSQPDLFSRNDMTSISQDGQTFQARDEDSFLLAPLAKKALSRCSWMRSRSVRLSRGRQSRIADRMSDPSLACGMYLGGDGRIYDIDET